MRIISWNINSIRLRIDHVLRVIDEYQPDIFAIQETKTPDDKFPFDAIKQTDLCHMHIHGMKGYNGVAILSRYPFLKTQIFDRVGQSDCRHISATISADHLDGYSGKDIEIHNLYIPAGGDEPDPATNKKFQHKLDFVDEMTAWFADHYTNQDALVALGDFNIAPHEHDVWSHKQLLKIISHTPAETSRLQAMQNSLDWSDSAREFVPGDEKSYSWWSYRNRDWKKSNRGRRLDHIWVTPPLKGHLTSYTTIPSARDWEKPSDHIPIITDL